MLTIHTHDDAPPRPYRGGALPPDVVWLDLLEPDEGERRVVEELTGMALPSREEIDGIGLSGRNRAGGDALHIHMSLFSDEDQLPGPPSPLGILLTPRLMVSLRYAASRVFAEAAEELQADRSSPTSADALVMLIEAIVEHTTARMQDIAAQMGQLSDRVFVRARLRTPTLRGLMNEVGRMEGHLTRIRTSLLGVSRMLVFLCERDVPWLPKAARQQLQILGNDVRTLDEFDQQLTDKMQFLLDAILGFINTDQNDVMKLLTVVSVATIPPVILAGVWGMNFDHMPELKAPWGYPMALSALVLSTLLPLLGFGLRGWLSGEAGGPSSLDRGRRRP